MTDGTWAEGVTRFQAVQRGGVIHGPGEGVPIRVDPSREQILTAEQASTRAREVLQTALERTSTAASTVTSKPLDHCQQCGQRILIMINRGQGYCSEQCRKALADE